jgi:uncharacterized protein
MTQDLLLYCFAFMAGLIDSIAGGGGLIQLPALLIFLPGAPVAMLLGTNKLASICGTSTATVQYARHVGINWQATLPAALTAFILSFMGARTAVVIRADVMRLVVFLLLIAIAIYTFRKQDFGSVHTPRLTPQWQKLFAIAAGAVIGFYDGFFGPGTGSFLIFVFIGLFGFNFLSASASSKLVNFATNLSAVLYFAWTGNVIYRLAIPMAVCNIIGSLIGTRLAIVKGSRFVRIIFLLVVSAMIARIGWDILTIHR